MIFIKKDAHPVEVGGVLSAGITKTLIEYLLVE